MSGEGPHTGMECELLAGWFRYQEREREGGVLCLQANRRITKDAPLSTPAAAWSFPFLAERRQAKAFSWRVLQVALSSLLVTKLACMDYMKVPSTPFSTDVIINKAAY